MIETAIATCVGALAAFILEAYRRHRQEISKNAVNGNRVLFRLQQNWNTMAQYRRDVIDPVRDNPARGIALQRTQEYELYDKIRPEDLDFLMDRYPQLIVDVVIEDELYRANIRAINERSEQYKNEIQIPLGEASFKETDQVTRDELVRVIGERSFVEICRLTDQIVENIDSSIESSMKIQPMLRAKLLYTCPRKGFLKFEAYEAALTDENK